jgi:hypothetical protein
MKKSEPWASTLTPQPCQAFSKDLVSKIWASYGHLLLHVAF